MKNKKVKMKKREEKIILLSKGNCSNGEIINIRRM